MVGETETHGTFWKVVMQDMKKENHKRMEEKSRGLASQVHT